jgi:hypothetical protein
VIAEAAGGGVGGTVDVPSVNVIVTGSYRG